MREEMRSHRAIAELAGRQHGVVSHAQLVRLGLSKSAIERHRLAARLFVIHRGVYAVGHDRITNQGRCLAAVLASGAGAMASHRSAAWLWGLVGRLPRPVDVTVRGSGRHKRRDLRLHCSEAIRPEDETVVEGIATTAVPRTLLDLAAAESAKTVEGLLERADRLGLLDLIAVEDVLRRMHGAPGTRQLRDALDIYRDPSFTRSLLERRFLALVRSSGLPRPAMNCFVNGIEVDAYWEAERFGVELDGFETHRTRAAFERDRMRQEDLKLAGIDSIRITARRLEREPWRVASNLRKLLARRRRELGRS
jgi:hypothetical protein